MRGQKLGVGSWVGGGRGRDQTYRGLGGHLWEREYLPETTMASFGPQVKNMVQTGAGGEGEEAFADGKGALWRPREGILSLSDRHTQSASATAQFLPRSRVR